MIQAAKQARRLLENWFYWLLCLPPFVKNLSLRALVLKRPRQDPTLARRRRRLLLPQPGLKIVRRSPPR